jgi:hypothetical protein
LQSRPAKALLPFRVASAEEFGDFGPGCQLLAYDMAQPPSAGLLKGLGGRHFRSSSVGKVMVRWQVTLANDDASRCIKSIFVWAGNNFSKPVLPFTFPHWILCKSRKDEITVPCALGHLTQGQGNVMGRPIAVCQSRNLQSHMPGPHVPNRDKAPPVRHGGPHQW